MDFVQFEDECIPGGMYRAQWVGPWPPPERMVVCVGESGYVTVTTPEIIDKHRAELSDAGTVTLTTFKRVSHSLLDPDPHPNLARGAMYRPEDHGV